MKLRGSLAAGAFEPLDLGLDHVPEVVKGLLHLAVESLENAVVLFLGVQHA